MSRFSQPTILMCPPDFYGIEYEINPWMRRDIPCDAALAQAQWQGLCELLQACGVDVRLMTPQPGLPDLVFTANAGLVWRETIFLSAFRHPARQGETPVDRDWFQSAGLTTVELPAGMNFEGAGDALFCGDTLFAGYFIRSDATAMHWLAEQIGCRVIPLQLVDERFYHLDTCFCPLSATSAIALLSAFDEYARRALAAIPQLIAVHPAEAARFACNAVVIGSHVILNTGCPRLEADLSAAGFTPHATPLDEFLKAGGSAKCLTLRLDGEDAAIWP